MIFGTQIGVVPGSLAMRFGGTMPQGQPFCPPDPIWRYFPSPFEPLTYFLAPGTLPAPPMPPKIISIEPPPRPGYDDPFPEDKTWTPSPPRPQAPAMTPVMPEPIDLPRPPQMPMTPVSPRQGAFIPYGNEAKLSGFGQPGPFGMTWAGFLGILGTAVVGGIGLGYLYHKRS